MHKSNFKKLSLKPADSFQYDEEKIFRLLQGKLRMTEAGFNGNCI